MNLTIDIGNTNVMISLFNKKRKIDSLKIRTTRLNKKEIVEFIMNHILDKANVLALISSVVPECTNFFKDLFNEKKIKYFMARKFIKLNKIKTSLSNENSIGDDRLINIIYGKHLFSKSLLIIDFGTATTIDVLNKRGVYDGGVITPGIDLSLLSLKKGTAKLPLVKFRKTKNIVGKNTLEAIQSGFFWGYISMIEGLVRKIEKSQNNNFSLVLTGGNSLSFKGCFKNVIQIDQYFNSKGLNYLINSNARKNE